MPGFDLGRMFADTGSFGRKDGESIAAEGAVRARDSVTRKTEYGHGAGVVAESSRNTKQPDSGFTDNMKLGASIGAITGGACGALFLALVGGPIGLSIGLAVLTVVAVVGISALIGAAIGAGIGAHFDAPTPASSLSISR